MPSSKGETCWFQSFFVHKATAAKYRMRVTDFIDEYFHYTKDAPNYTVLPPLLAHAKKRESLSLKMVRRDMLTVTDKKSFPDVTILFYAEGPIIPIIRSEKLNEFDVLLKRIYGTKKLLNAITIQETIQA